MLRQIPLRVNVVPETLTAAPGSVITLSMTIYNATEVIDGFEVSLIGINRDDVVTEPDWVSLFPDSEQTVTVTATLPTDFPAGPHHLGVKVSSKTNPAVVWVEEILVDVIEQGAAQMLIDPETATATRVGRFGLTLTNTGNRELNFGFVGDDAENHLTYDFEPEALELPPGQSRSVQLSVSGKRPFTGSPDARPFTVVATAPEQTLEASAILSLEPRIPRLALILAGIAAMFALWALVIGAAIDGIVDDTDQDLAAAFEEGIESVVGAVDPDAVAGTDLAGGGGVAGAVDEEGNPAAAPTSEDEAGGEAGAGDPVTILDSTVTALVVSASNGRPLPGATATLISLFDAGSRTGQMDPNRDPIEVAADETGVFATEDTPRGLYELEIDAVGYFATRCEIEVPFDTSTIAACGVIPAAETGEQAVALRGFPASISGIATVEGDPEAGITLNIRRLRESDGVAIDGTGEPAPGDGLFTDPVITAANGRWTFALSAPEPDSVTPGVFEIEASGPGLVTNRVVFDMAAGQHLVGIEIPLAIAITGDGSVIGTVVDSAGAGLGGVSVTIAGDGVGATGTTLSEGAVGSFKVGRLPVADLTATFQREGFVPKSLAFSIAADNPDTGADEGITNLGVVVLEEMVDGVASGMVQGTVTDTDGNPLGGVTVSVSGTDVSLTTTTLTTPGNGRSVGSFVLEGLKPGPLTSTFSKSGFETASISFVITEAAPAANLGTVVLQPIFFGSVTGTVIRPDGTSLTGTDGFVGATLSLDGPDDFSATSVVVATDGSFAVSSLPEGAYALTVSAPQFLSQTVGFTISTDATTADVGIIAMKYVPVAITGIALSLDSGGDLDPLVGAALTIDGTAVGTSDAAGAFTTTPQAIPASYTLRFEASGHAPVEVTTTVLSPGSATLTSAVVLPELITLTFDLLDESGFAPFPLPFFDESGLLETPPEPTVTFQVTSWTETDVTGVDFTTPLSGSVSDSTASVAGVPVGGSFETTLLITPNPGDSFVPFTSDPIVTAFADGAAALTTSSLEVPFDPGAVYGGRGSCNLIGSFQEIYLDVGALGEFPSFSESPWLLTNDRYLFFGIETTGIHTVYVFEDFEFVAFEQQITLTGASPAVFVDLDEPCSVFPG